MSDVHSQWGGSRVMRNVRCTAAPQACARLPKTPSSEYAREGRLAHALAEVVLKDGASPYRVIRAGMEFNVAEEHEQAEYRKPDTEMADILLDGYINLVKMHRGQIFIEREYPFLFAPGNKGTADFTCYQQRKRRLIIADLKYGMGDTVYAEGNEQLEAYAIAAIDELKLWKEIDEVVLEIYQPRLNHFDSHKVSTKYLTERKQFFAAKYEESTSKQATFVPGNRQCFHCDYLASCTAAFTYLSALAEGDTDTSRQIVEDPMKITDLNDLEPDQIAPVVENRRLINKFVDQCQERLLDLLSQGAKIECGLKIVEGNGRRKWVDEEKAENELKRMRIKAEDMYKIELVSPAQAESLVGKRQKIKIESLIVRTPGKPTLAPLNDKRPVLSAIADEFDVVTDSFDLGLDVFDEDDDLGL